MDQLKQLIEALVVEGKLEKETTDTARLVLAALKKKLKEKKGEKPTKEFKEFKFIVGAPDSLDISKIIVYVKDYKKVGTYIDAVFKSNTRKLQDNVVKIFFGLQSLDFEKTLRDAPNLYNDLKDIIRHEFEHSRQSRDDYNRIKGYDLNNLEDVIRYCLDPAEIAAQVAGMYKQAKMRKESLSDIFSEKQTEIIRLAKRAGASESSAQDIVAATLDAWEKYAKKKFPSAIV